ncbi:MAG: lipid A biosynthesis (KDO)2-(lauroyl)-lipid IVA acyltransferase [Paludibacteraceae bacterium]|nr:lipid A biosynthesis (KDO)2-(lauroyl)-lipid IVA acyltransferase [Paludibacteraceae bacterium]
MENKDWKGKTGGGWFGQNFLLMFLAKVRVVWLYPVLYLVIPFYLIFARKGYHAIYSYFHDHLHYSKWRAFVATCRNHLLFGEVVLDKFAILAGYTSQFKVEMQGEDVVSEYLDGESGFIIASAHFGNLEMAGLSIRQEKKRMNGIIFGGERGGFQDRRDSAFGKMNINLIPVSEDMSHLFTIKNALEEGEVVTIPCDRFLGGKKKVSLDFLDGEADFPVGTFRLAAQLNVPVVSLFIVKINHSKYYGYSRLLRTSPEAANSTEQAKFLAKQFVAELEAIVRQYPLQWFNYYQFWKS